MHPPLQPGDTVVLLRAPTNLLAGLPLDDQAEILAIVGKPVKFAGLSFGQAEIVFTDTRGDHHTLWIDPKHIAKA